MLGGDEIAAGTVTIKDLDLGRELARQITDNSQWREPCRSDQRDDEIDQNPAWGEGSVTHGSPAAVGHSATLRRAAKPREE